MSTLNSMIKKLSPLGIYNLNKGSIVYAELAAFAEGLDILRETLDSVLRESFVATAEDYGLKNTERLVGNIRDDLSFSKRRDMLKERLSLNLKEFTMSGVEKMLRMLAVTGSVEESPQTQSIVIKVSDEGYSAAQKEWIVSQVVAFLPSHLESSVVFE